MNRTLKRLLVLALFLPFLVAGVALAENKFQLLTKTWHYAEYFGTFAFFSLAILTLVAIASAVVSYGKKPTVSFAASSLLAAIATVGLFLPNQARAIQNYYSHEQQQIRFIIRLNNQLIEQPRFCNVRLSYWHGKGDGCRIEGTVPTNEDLVALETIVASRTSLFIENEAGVNESQTK